MCFIRFHPKKALVRVCKGFFTVQRTPLESEAFRFFILNRSIKSKGVSLITIRLWGGIGSSLQVKKQPSPSHYCLKIIQFNNIHLWENTIFKHIEMLIMRH
jgi:hypothetical protein